jgi:hypothetical protein
MAYIIEVRETPSISDLFRDAARHKLTEMEHYSSVVPDFKSARIVIEPESFVLQGFTFTNPMRFSFGNFDLLWMGVEEFDGKECGKFIGTGRYQDKRTFIHQDWIEMEETDLMFECCQEFMKVCQSLRNGELKPFEDHEVTEPWNREEEDPNT